MAEPATNEARLVLHADDFGMNRAVTAGILRGFRDGLLTSTSVLANAPEAGSALSAWNTLLRDQKAGCLPSGARRQALAESALPFDLGVHLNLTQGAPLTGSRFPAELCDEHGRFSGPARLFRRLWRSAPRLEPALLAELSAQVEVLLEQGLAPTHLNGHQYIECLPGLETVVRQLLLKYRIGALRVAVEPGLTGSIRSVGFQPLNWCLARVKHTYACRFRRRIQSWGVSQPQCFFGTSHAGRITLPLLQRFVGQRDASGLTEIGLHPGQLDSSTNPVPGWEDPLAALRPSELEMLTGPPLASWLVGAGVRLGRLASAWVPMPSS